MKYLVTQSALILLVVINIFESSEQDNGINNESQNTCSIETVQLYPKLNFEVMTPPLWIWDESMELRYWKQLTNWHKKSLKVIVVPFSHNDAGWLETFEDYFDKKTRYILDNAVNVMPHLTEMTFVWSEICFLQRWWDRTTEESKMKFKNLVKDGRLEILTGGWVMPDEAVTHLFALHNQLVEGQQWVWENLGIVPESSWSIDPFGCSSVMAYLLAGSGIQNLVIQRIHYSWKRFFSCSQLVDLVWSQECSVISGDIRLHIQSGPGYSVTDSCGPALTLCADFDFNRLVAWNEHITFSNIHKKAELLLGLYGRLGSLSPSNVALVTLGGDFRFENETEWYQQFRNYKAIMDYVNCNKKLYNAVIVFGTLSQFFQYANESYGTVKGDFFPYADLNMDLTLAYWTGFYSTRPYWKKLSRNLEAMLRSTEILYTLILNAFRQYELWDKVSLLEKLFHKLIRARRNCALFQHHDGITGTAKARVMLNYKEKLYTSLNHLKLIQQVCSEALMLKDSLGGSEKEYRNITETDDCKKMVLFNSLPYYKEEVVVIKTNVPNVRLLNHEGKDMPFQINYLCKRDTYLQIKEDNYEMVFLAFLPPLSLNVFQLSLTADCSEGPDENINYSANNPSNMYIANCKQQITFGENGLISSIIKNDGCISLCTNLKSYNSEEGNSGAYLFKPSKEPINVYSNTAEGNIIYSEGCIYKEVKAIYGTDYMVQTRLYETDSYLSEIVEVKVTYNISDSDTELFIEFVTDMKETRFYTDVNSFHMRERLRVHDQSIEGNYYPVTSLTYLENMSQRFIVMCDHSHGAASLEDGALEIMLDRRITADDKRGLEEGVQDKLRATSTFYLMLEYMADDCVVNLLTLQLNNPSPVFRVRNEVPTTQISLISAPLPDHIHLLNLRTVAESDAPSSKALLTLHNQGCCSTCDATFPEGTIFDFVKIRKIIKTSLTGLQETNEFDELHEIKVNPFNIKTLQLIF